MDAEVGRRLRIARLRRGMTREALAERLSVPTGEIKAIERGEMPLAPDTVERAAALLEFSLAAANENHGFESRETVRGGFRSPRIGVAVRERRIALGQSRSFLADVLDCTDTHIMAIEEGRAPLDIAMLFGLAVALETTPERLYHPAMDHPGLERLLDHSNVLMTLLDSLKARAR